MEAIAPAPYSITVSTVKITLIPAPMLRKLNQLFDLLYTKVPPTGFKLGSIGIGKDRVNGLALCRGDVNTTNCMSCVNEESKKLQERCPDKRGAIVWYDYCLLKYTNEYFFGQIDEENKFYMLNTHDVDDSTTFNGKVNEFLRSLSYKASESPKLFATGELKLQDSKTLYGLGQRTRDLLETSCEKCLDDAISEPPDCCD